MSESRRVPIEFAPLEGITDGIFRRTHHACFAGVERYFIPFVCPTQHLTFNSREQRALSPEENAGVPVVAQVLTKNPEHFLWMANALSDVGYRELNLNLGCPSGTVTAKGKGAAMLRDPDGLRRFLDTIFAGTPIPVSVKTRIGWEDPGEWPGIRAVLLQYPFCEVIVHPRTRGEFYEGKAHREACEGMPDGLSWTYNGDLRTVDDCLKLTARFPGASRLMIGRGLVANPALAQEWAGGEALTLASLRAFHDRLFAGYMERWPGNAVTGHMREIMRHILTNLEVPPKLEKALRKANRADDYESAARAIFDCAVLKI